MPQGVIQRSDTSEFLRRKGSYAKHSWTHELQDAQVFSLSGIEQAVKSLGSRWDLDIDGERPMFAVLPVLIVRP